MTFRVPGKLTSRARKGAGKVPERDRKGAGKGGLGNLLYIEDLGDLGILDILLWGVRQR